MKRKIYYLPTIFVLLSLLYSCDIDPLEKGGRKLADFELVFEKGWGTSDTDDFAGAVIDNNGFMYFVGSSSGSGFIHKVFINKISLTDNSLVWSKRIDSQYSNFFPSPSENGVSQGGGGSRCIALDESGDIYIAGTSVQGFNQAFVLKLNSSGDIVWQTNWKGDNSELARSSAKAYAIDVKNNRVYVVGSTGAGQATEEAMAFLLMLNTANGEVLETSKLGIDPSPGYNDRAYTVKADGSGKVFVGGWAGQSNSGLLMRFSQNGDNLDWCKTIALGTGSRITDIDIDNSGNLYLACDFRGVSTDIGVLKLDNNASFIWGHKFRGENNDRNNVSCLRVINSFLYVGGRGSFKNYDLSQFGDGCLLKFSLDGKLLEQYNYYTGDGDDQDSGERIEAINYYNEVLYLSGEMWPEYQHVAGNWFVPKGSASSFNPDITSVNEPQVIQATGYADYSISWSTTNTQDGLFSLESGNKGSSDVVIFGIKE